MSYHASAKHGRQSSSWMQQPGILGAIGRFWQRSYAPDYLGFALLVTAHVLVRKRMDEKVHLLTYCIDGLLLRTIPSHVLPRRPVQVIPACSGGKSASLMVVRVWRWYPASRYDCVAIDCSSWTPPGPCYAAGTLYQPGINYASDQRRQKLCRAAST